MYIAVYSVICAFLVDARAVSNFTRDMSLGYSSES